MGLIKWLFGGGVRAASTAVTEVAEVFTSNAEQDAMRAATALSDARAQFAAEFRAPKSWWDSFIDGLNRLPRPMMALGTIGLFACAIAYVINDPVGFAVRMQAVGLVPVELWMLLSAVVSFYFGARELQKNRDMRVVDPAHVARVLENIDKIKALAPPINDPSPLSPMLAAGGDIPNKNSGPLSKMRPIATGAIS